MGKVLRIETKAISGNYLKIYVFIETSNGKLNKRYRYYNNTFEETAPGVPLIEPVFFEGKELAESERSIDDMIAKTIKEVEGMSDSITSTTIEDLNWDGQESID